MIISAVIAEFNPFHEGHRRLFLKMREESDAIIAIMSTHFVQRGDCAVYPKAIRAGDAVLGGADLVIDLPCVYALSSAEHFSEGAVRTLDACGCVDKLFFGSECGDIKLLSRAAEAELCGGAEFERELKKKLSDGLSYARARAEALSEYGEVLKSPNNILGVEYIKALNKIHSAIKPFTIKREGGGYNDASPDVFLPSATAIRAKLKESRGAGSVFIEDFDEIFAAAVKTASTEDLMSVPDCNREIAARIKKAADKNTFEEICLGALCKRYPLSRIRRIIINLAIRNRFRVSPLPQYIRPCAFNKKGAEILRMIKSGANLPVADRGADIKGSDIFALECRAADIYNLVQKKEGGAEYRETPVKIF